MSRTLHIAWRDMRAFFLQPAGWIVPALFLFGSGLVFVRQVLVSGRPATMQAALGFDAVFILLAGPALAMGAICEERRRGTLELLQASPVSTAEIVVGKWLGGVGIMLAVLVPTVLQVILLEIYGRPDLGEIVSGYLGLILLGSAVVATTVAASAVLAGQAVVFLVCCLGWILVSVVIEVALPPLLGPTWRDTLGAIDPLHRFQDFSLGLLDSANIVYFLAIVSGFLVLAVAVLGTRATRRTATAAGLAGLAVALVAVVVISMTPEAQLRFDMTKSRAYSLSPRTEALLDELEGDWQVRLILVEDRADIAMLRQVDEVLARFAQAAPSLRVGRLDPTDPSTLLAWESVLATVREQGGPEIDRWRSVIDDADAALTGLILFAQHAAGPLRRAAPTGTDGDDLRAGAAALALLAAEGDRILDSVHDALTMGPAHPMPDWGTAQAILHAALSRWAVELDGLGRQLAAIDSDLPAAADAQAFAAQAARLAIVADLLGRLPELSSANLGRQLAEGEAAIVIGPDGSRIIPASRLMPRTFTDVDDAGQVRFDQRFRGEQLIASAIRSLQDDRMMRVVFVHDQDESILDSGRPQEDVAAVASMLATGGAAIAQWAPHAGDEPPEWSRGATAWVVIPPTQRPGLQTSLSEQALLDAVRRLIDRGEGVLVSIFPGPHGRLGRVDPWASLLRSIGVQADSSTVLLRDRDGGAPEVAVELADFPAPHPVGEALHGQSLLLPLAVPIRSMGDGRNAVELGFVPASPDLWIEDEWHSLVATDERLRRAGPRFDPEAVPEGPTPVIAAVETSSGGRVLVVGSGNWMRTAVADAATSAGGDRVALVHPGNHELMGAGTAWVAGLDDGIARGALSQEVARLGSIPAGARTAWAWILLAGLPLGALAMGALVGIWRRS